MPPRRPPRQPSRVESHNALSLETIRESYLPAASELSWQGLEVSLHTARSLSKPQFDDCFALVRDNMKDMYKRSTMGWSAVEKKNEMKHPAMRYLVLEKVHVEQAEDEPQEETWEQDDDSKDWEDGDDDDVTIVGFLSFMVTEEGGNEVLYCYEVQMVPQYRGSGSGSRLMHIMEEFGRAAGLTKAMLTVFIENEGAQKLYRRLGYSEDEISPEPVRLRSGELRMPSYNILSKKL